MEHGAWADTHSPTGSAVPVLWHGTSDSPRQPSTWDLQDPACPSAGTPAGEQRDGGWGGHDLQINASLNFTDPNMYLTTGILTGTV